jgi:hypothetical protein
MEPQEQEEKSKESEIIPPEQSEKTRVLITELEELHNIIRHPKVYSSKATAQLHVFNIKYGPEGLFMKAENACNNDVIIRILQLLNFIATNTVSGTKKIFIEAGARETADAIDEFITQSSFTLGLLARNKEARETIVKKGGRRIFMSLLKDHNIENDRQIFVNYCFALGQILLSVKDDEEKTRTQEVMSSDFYERLEDVLRRYSDDAQIVQYTCFLLGNMTYVIDVSTYKWSEGLIEQALGCLEKYQKSPPVVTDVIFFLKNVSSTEDGRTKLGKDNNKALKTIITLLTALREYGDYVEFSVNLLFDMSFCEPMCDTFSTPLFHKFIFSLLKKHHRNPAVLTQCTRLLTRIYKISSEQIRGDLIKEGLVSSLIYGCQTFQNDAETVSVFHELLKNIGTESFPRAFTKDSSQRMCDLCPASFNGDGYDEIHPAFFSSINQAIPLFWRLCSEECKRGLENGLPRVGNAAIQESNIENKNL